jgi:hypothetical protein
MRVLLVQPPSRSVAGTATAAPAYSLRGRGRALSIVARPPEAASLDRGSADQGPPGLHEASP